MFHRTAEIVGMICGVLAYVTGEHIVVRSMGLAMIVLSLWLASNEQV